MIRRRFRLHGIFLLLTGLLALAHGAGCTRAGPASPASRPDTAFPERGSGPSASPDPCVLVLLPLEDERLEHERPREAGGRLALETARLQEEARRRPDPATLERLGWLLVARARESSDPGLYRLAEACASCLESKRPGAPEALLLRGHALQSLHRFVEAEALARALVARRGSAFDHGLLGDCLLEQGRLEEAAESYQAMLDLKPCLQSYARAAELRWLKGDSPGARDLFRLAAQAAGGRDAEAAAWVRTRLARQELLAGSPREALEESRAALRLLPGHAAALIAEGRALLALGRAGEAVSSLEQAASRSRLPESRWALADGLRLQGREHAAREVESALERDGEALDPRTFSLYLSTRRRQPELAVRLAREELASRGDVFTHDALAWALLASGAAEEAGPAMERALREGTGDPRLHLHAAAIARARGQEAEARRWAGRAAAARAALLPSEEDRLKEIVPSSP